MGELHIVQLIIMEVGTGRRLLEDLIAGLFILLFVYTAIDKLREFDRFRYVIGRLPIAGRFDFVVACLVIIAELTAAILLFFPGLRGSGFRLSALLMLVFTIYIGAMLAFMEKLPCSCGGVLSSLSWRDHLFLNAALTGLCFLGIYIQRRSKILLQ